MNYKIIQVIKMISKYSLYAFALQCLFMSIVMASGASAQYKSVKEVQLNINAGTTSLLEVFEHIEATTDYKFYFHGKDVKVKQQISLSQNPDQTVADVLASVSKQARLKFKQVNNNISVSALKKSEEGQPVVVSIRDVEIQGKITDENGEGLPGASVVVKGTAIGTTSDLDGNYKLSAPEGAMILVSFVGYSTQEITLGAQTVLDIQMVPDAEQLEEVVIVGYGTQEKTKLVGAVAQVEAEKINDRPVAQLRQALTGQMPGVTVIQRSGQPGNLGGEIQIRGVNSVNSSNGALILVDGIPTNSFNDINPNVVESISVLKDASASAIYGARAANGVILITTKLGKADKLNVSYNGYVGVQIPTEFPEYVDSWEYAGLLNEANENGGAGLAYTDAEIELFRNGSDPDNYPNSDFRSAIFKDRSVLTSHNLSIANKTGNTNYLFGLGYLDQGGLVPENNYKRYNLNLNLVSEISKKMKLTTRLTGRFSKDEQPTGPPGSNGSNMLNIIGQSVRIPSIFPIKLQNGDWGVGFQQAGTPASWIGSDGFYNRKEQELGLNLKYDWNILDDLKFSIIGGYNSMEAKQERFASSQLIAENILLGPAQQNMQRDGYAYSTFQQVLEYNKLWNDHQFSLMAAHTYEFRDTDELTAFRSGFPSNDLTELNAGEVEGSQNGSTGDEWAMDSYFGRLRYSYQNKYLLEAVVRHDGYSGFRADRRYATFPSLAAGWRLSQESFMENTANWLSELKFKASWGQVGNNQVNAGAGGLYPYQSLFTNTSPEGSTRNYNYGFGGTVTTGLAIARIPDPEITWETQEMIDVGVEASIKDGLIDFSATYFNKKTKDALLAQTGSVPQTLGFTVGVTNAGTILNEGMEIELGHNRQLGDFGYSVSTNVTFLRNEVLDLGKAGVEQLNGFIANSSTYVGHPLQNYYGLVADGLFVDEADIASYPDQSEVNTNGPNRNGLPGDIRYKDISGPDGVPDGKVDLIYDRTVIGSRIPKVSYGINLGANYKGIGLNILIQGVSGVDGQMGGTAGQALVNQGTIQRWQADGRWTPENPDRNAVYPRLEVIPNGGIPNSQTSTFWLSSASYLKVRNIQLTYNLPRTILDKIHLQNVQLRASGENLFSFHGYRQGWDPEINTSLNYYPIMANYTFGVKIDF